MKKAVEVLDNVTGAPRIVRSPMEPIDSDSGRLPVDSVLTVAASEKVRETLVKVTGIGETTLRVETLGLASATGWTMPPATESEGWYGFLVVEGDEHPTYALAISSAPGDHTQSEPDLQIPLRRDRLFLVDIDRKIEVLPFLPLAGTGVDPMVLAFHMYETKPEEVT